MIKISKKFKISTAGFITLVVFTLLSIVCVNGCVSAPAPPKYTETELQKIIIAASSDRRTRFQAINIAITEYPQKAPLWLGMALTNTFDMEVLDFILDKLEQVQGHAALEYLAISSLPTKDQQARAIQLAEKISGKKHPEYLFDLVNKQWDEPDKFSLLHTPHTALLWEKLLNNYSETEIIDWLQNISPKNKITKTASYCFNKYCYLPDKHFEIIQCIKLTDETKAEQLRINDKLNVLFAQNYKFNISDTGLLHSIKINHLQIDRDVLEAEISGFIKSADHISRPPAYSKAPNDIPDDFESQKYTLSITDLYRIREIIKYLESDVSLSELIPTESPYKLKTETGGLIQLDKDKLNFIKYEPQSAAGHHRYLESTELLKDAFYAFSRWHIHDQRETNRNLTGPGTDDIIYAKALQTSIVIITILETPDRQLKANLDYINKDGKIIDIAVVDI